MTEHRCHRGTRCLRWEHHAETGGRLGARINAEHGLCDPCARHVEKVLTELPRDYVELHQVLARVPQLGRDQVSGTPELPIPIRTEVEALQTALVHEALCWAESVADVLGIVLDTQHARDARPGVVLQRSCRLLASSVTVLLALRDVHHLGWVYGCCTVLTRDGLDGALELLELHHRVRAVTGQTRFVQELDAPCPRCEHCALQREDGSEVIDCVACGRRYTWQEYWDLCTILANRRELVA